MPIHPHPGWLMRSIRREKLYPHPPRRVWLALTEPRIIASWLMPTEQFSPVVGCHFRFRTTPAPGFDGIIHCAVVEVEPERRLAYTWASGKSVSRPTTVAWTLAPAAAGTLLTLEHTGFHGVGGFVLRGMLGSGWGKKMEQFMNVVLARLAAAGDDVATSDASSLAGQSRAAAGAGR